MPITVIIWLIIASTLFIGSQLAAATPIETDLAEIKTQSTEWPIHIANLRVYDLNGIQRIFYLQGHELELATTLDSRNGYGGHVITQVRDESGVTVMLGTQSIVHLESPQTVRIPY